MAIAPTSCSTFIQIWVDATAVQTNATTGIYLVDNNISHGSTNEGTPTLNTQVPQNTQICWSILNVDPNSTATLSIQNFGNSNAFGPNGTPQKVNPTTWTGQVENTGNAGYTITLNVRQSSGQLITTTVAPSFTVVAA